MYISWITTWFCVIAKIIARPKDTYVGIAMVAIY